MGALIGRRLRSGVGRRADVRPSVSAMFRFVGRTDVAEGRVLPGTARRQAGKGSRA